MPRDKDRDRLLDQLLRQPGSDRSALSKTDVCVDGETLAAWTAGALRAAEAAAVETHVADCARCQTMLATLARTAPPAAVADAWWRRWHVRWLVPIATAATVAALWVAVPNQQPDREEHLFLEGVTDAEPSPQQQPQQEREAANLSAPPAPAVSAPAAPAQPSRSDRKLVARESQLQAKADAASKLVEGRSAPAQDRLAREMDRPLAAGKPLSRARDERAAAPTPSNAAAPPPAEPKALEETITVMRQRPTVVEIASPDTVNRWRLAGGTVQRSTDAGVRWETATIASDDDLTAGHAPASSIAWLVGRRGAVYVTADGSRFVRVAFVEPVDLVYVFAIDDRQATVTAADGRTFSTTDRGVSWTREPPDD